MYYVIVKVLPLLLQHYRVHMSVVEPMNNFDLQNWCCFKFIY